MINSGIMPQAPTSLTLRRFSSFAAPWCQQEEYHQRAERAQRQFENERKRREADDFYVSTMMVILAVIFTLSQFACFLYSRMRCPAQCLKKMTGRVRANEKDYIRENCP